MNFECEWSIGDTAAYSYKGQQPETVFDKMLELAPSKFNNIRNDKLGNAAGKILFVVEVFKEREGEGNEGDPVLWNTGVRIY